MSTVNKIDLEKLEEYITKLENLHTSWVDKVYMPIDVADNSGKIIQEMCNLDAEYQKLKMSFVNLVDKTIQYMSSRKAAVEAQENVATNSMETYGTIVKPGASHGGVSNKTNNTAMIK